MRFKLELRHLHAEAAEDVRLVLDDVEPLRTELRQMVEHALQGLRSVLFPLLKFGHDA